MLPVEHPEEAGIVFRQRGLCQQGGRPPQIELADDREHGGSKLEALNFNADDEERLLRIANLREETPRGGFSRSGGHR